MSDAKTCSSYSGKNLYISKVHLVVSCMNNLIQSKYRKYIMSKMSTDSRSQIVKRNKD